MDIKLQTILKRCNCAVFQINFGISRISRNLINKPMNVRDENIVDACNRLRSETQHIQDVIETISGYTFQDWYEVQLYDNEYKELYINIDSLMRQLFDLYRYYETKKLNKYVSEIDNIICPSNLIEIYTMVENING